MRQRISDNIDAHRVGHLFGEAQKVFMVFSFAFPAVAEVVVVAEEGHHAAISIEVGPEVRTFIAPGVTVSMLVEIAFAPSADVDHLG